MNFAPVLWLLKRFSLTSFALILLCFFLPFFSFTACDDQMLFSATGYETAYGVEVPILQQFQPPGTKPRGSPLTILVLLLTVAGIVFSIVKINVRIKQVKLADLMLLFVGGAGFLLMMLHVYLIDFVIRNKQIRVEYGAGFVLTCLLFLLNAAIQSAICFLQLIGRDDSESNDQSTARP